MVLYSGSNFKIRVSTKRAFILVLIRSEVTLNIFKTVKMNNILAAAGSIEFIFCIFIIFKTNRTVLFFELLKEFLRFFSKIFKFFPIILIFPFTHISSKSFHSPVGNIVFYYSVHIHTIKTKSFINN
jgi:hypothetical protein